MDGNEIRLLILVADEKNIEESCRYLNKHGYIVETTTSIQQCITLSLKFRPDYVLLSFNHSSSKILMLPKLITQTSKAEPIVFAEFMNGTVEARLNKTNQRQVIFPPINGPTLARKIQAIRLDKNRSAQSKGTGSKDDSDSVYVKSVMVADKEKSVHVKGKVDVKEPPRPSKDQPASSVEEVIPEKDSNVSDKSPVEADQKVAISAVPIPEVSADTAKSKDRSKYQKSLDKFKQILSHIPEVESQKGPESVSLYTDRKKTETSTAGVLRVRKNLPKLTLNEHFANEGYESLSEYAEASMAGLMSPDSNGSVSKIGQTSAVVCLSLDSEQFRGYVLAATARADEYRSLLPEIQKRLVNYLSEEGIEISEDDINDLDIQDVQFLDWAKEEAEFLKVADHEGGEVAMAFFRDEQKLSTFLTSAEEEMVVVSIEDLSPDEPVQCDVYLHMPVNGRFLLYAKAGQKLVRSQKPRLIEHGVLDLHIKREDIKKFKKYQAKKFFNGKAS